MCLGILKGPSCASNCNDGLKSEAFRSSVPMVSILVGRRHLDDIQVPTPLSRSTCSQWGGRMDDAPQVLLLDIRSRKASSNAVSRSRWIPTPLVRKKLVGTGNMWRSLFASRSYHADCACWTIEQYARSGAAGHNGVSATFAAKQVWSIDSAIRVETIKMRLSLRTAQLNSLEVPHTNVHQHAAVVARLRPKSGAILKVLSFPFIRLRDLR